MVDASRNVSIHRAVQTASRRDVFRDYRLGVAKVIRDYSKLDRAQAPVGVWRFRVVPDSEVASGPCLRVTFALYSSAKAKAVAGWAGTDTTAEVMT